MISQTHGPPPHKAAAGPQSTWLAATGHPVTPADADYTAYLNRLDKEGGVIHLVDRTSCRDAQFLRREMAAAEEAGVLFVMSPRPSIGRPTRPVMPAGEKDPADAWTLSRSQADDPAQYRVARKAAVDTLGPGSYPVIVADS